MATIVVEVRVSTRLARWWVRAMALLVPVVGAGRAIDWACRGAARLVRVEVIR
jgi:hypothetical protein